MTRNERAERITCWTWAASVLGVEAGPDRILGLVEVTAGVKLESLKPALELAIKSESKGFLPSPGAVIEAAKRLAEHATNARPRLAPGPMTSAERKRWDEDHNPEGWDEATWRAFSVRMKLDRAYSDRVKHALAMRHAWAAAECDRQIDKRRTSAGFRIDLRRQLNREAFEHYPRPHPTADGWAPPANAGDPLEALIASRALPSAPSPLPLIPSEPAKPADWKGLEAARTASSKRAPEPNPRSWS